MVTAPSRQSDDTVVSPPKEISSSAATEAAALFDPDVRDLLTILEVSRASANRAAA
jgi:hypothetical protein